ncbi:MAG: PilN domain-containing protein [Myxococcota bacterium]|nr:PilN domain-containing protein [Myxococcota bacterium]
MIRINLLPTRGVKKREAGRQVLVLVAALVIVGLVANFIWYQSRASAESANAAKIASTQAAIKKLEAVIGEVNEINKRKKEVEEKLKVLDSLKKARSGPVKLMDALAISTPAKVWIESFDEKNSDVKLKGSAVSHDDVAEFMRGLSNIVWTPKGMARVVEQKRGAKTARVELINQNGAIEDLPVAQVVPFFNAIDLKKAEQKGDLREPRVDFEIGLKANYAT